MNETPSLLHNMSAPPKSVVKYSGLSGLMTELGPGGSGVAAVTYRNRELFGEPVRFVLQEAFDGATPIEMLRLLGIAPEDIRQNAASRQLITLINRRAAELPLPEGCAVIPANGKHPVLWDDPLAALAVLSKSTDTVWLRGKTPALSTASRRGPVSLLVPPGFVHRLKEATS